MFLRYFLTDFDTCQVHLRNNVFSIVPKQNAYFYVHFTKTKHCSFGLFCE